MADAKTASAAEGRPIFFTKEEEEKIEKWKEELKRRKNAHLKRGDPIKGAPPDMSILPWMLWHYPNLHKDDRKALAEMEG